MFGSPTRTRTTDILINSQTLYQLSYRGISICSYEAGAAFWDRPKSKSSIPATHGTFYRKMASMRFTAFFRSSMEQANEIRM